MIINCTPHAINLPGREIKPSGQVARVSVDLVDAGQFDSVPLVHGEYGQVTDLPAPSEGVLYIVSNLVRAACPDRLDLASPARLVRDNHGRIIGCEALEVS
jgi:hypothetical protein